MAEQKPATVEESQPDKFRALARELGCDEDEKAFEEKVKRVAGTPINGEWSVVDTKLGGYHPLFTPREYGPTVHGPTFEREAEAEAWIAKQPR